MFLWLDDVIEAINSAVADVPWDKIQINLVKQSQRMCIYFAFSGKILVEAYTDKMKKSPKCIDGKLEIKTYLKLR
eukprot:7671547-Pyramimonas_sp.AAC.1